MAIQPTAFLNIAKKEGYTSPRIPTSDKVTFFVLTALSFVDPTGIVNAKLHEKYVQPAVQEKMNILEAEYAAKA